MPRVTPPYAAAESGGGPALDPPRLHENNTGVCIFMHMSKVRVAVAGASGTPAARCCGLLLGHPGSRSAPSHWKGATPVSASVTLQPRTVPLAERVLEPTTADVLAGHDVVFLGLPHGQSGALAARADRP